MNKRLLAFLRKLGLAADATDEAGWNYYRALRGLNASIANALNYAEDDEAARTNCDLQIRALGYDPENPQQMLPADPVTVLPGRQAGATGVPATLVPGSTLVEPAGAEREAALRVEGEQRAMQRVSAINDLGEFAGCSLDFVRALVMDPTVTVDMARERIREDRNQRTRAQEVEGDLPGRSPAGHSRNSVTNFSARAIAMSLMMMGSDGIDDPATRAYAVDRENGLIRASAVERPDDESLRARDRAYEIQNLPMKVLVQRALALDGIRCEPTTGSIINAMMSRGAAAMSTTSLVNIFTTTFGARLIGGWVEAGDTTEGWVAVGENQNYLPHEAVQVGLGEGLAHVPRGAEAEDMTYGDSKDYTKVFRYGRKLVFDEMDLVNDTFGVITSEAPRKLGAACRRLRPDLVYAILLANPTMSDSVALFHATHANTTAAAFSEAALEAAYTRMQQTRVSGVNVNITPRYVISPAALALAVEKVITPGITLIGSTTADVPRPNFTLMGRRGLIGVADARLDNGVVDPKSGTTYAGDLNDWYVVGDGPAPIEVTYLAGTRKSPRFRSGVLDQGQFGIWFDVQHALGAKALFYQTIQRQTA